MSITRYDSMVVSERKRKIRQVMDFLPKDDILTKMLIDAADLHTELGVNEKFLSKINKEIEELSFEINDFLRLGGVSEHEIWNSDRKRYGTTNAFIDNVKARIDKILYLRKIAEHGLRTKSNIDIMKDLMLSASEEKKIKNLMLDKLLFFQKSSGGLQAGYYIFVGEPGAGKTTFTQNAMLEALYNNPKSKAILFTLDDDSEKTIQRLVSYATARKAMSFGATSGLNTKDSLKKYACKINDIPRVISMRGDDSDARLIKKNEIREESFIEIANFIMDERLSIFDRGNVETDREIDHILSEKIDSDTLVFIDATRKIKIDSGIKGLEKDDAVADFVDGIAIKYKVPVLTTHEMTKISDEAKQGGLDWRHAKGSGSYAFNAKYYVFVSLKDRKKFKNGEDRTVKFWIEKNKITDITGDNYYELLGEYNFINPILQEENSDYNL